MYIAIAFMYLKKIGVLLCNDQLTIRLRSSRKTKRSKLQVNNQILKPINIVTYGEVHYIRNGECSKKYLFM